MTFRRKPNRLPPASYEGGIYFVTINCDEKRPHFADSGRAASCEEQLMRASAEAQADLLAYTVMPDHLHVLVGLYSEPLSTLVKDFKQVTGFQFKRETGLALWQRSFYDHVPRKEDDLPGIALYIAANPVRRGLVQDWEEYPFTGGGLLARGALPHPADGDLQVAATIATAPGGRP